MGRNDWEQGTLTLPTAAVSPLRKALVDASNRHHDAVLAECLRLWNGPIAKTSSNKLFRERLDTALRAGRLAEAVSDDVHYTMESLVGGYGGTQNPRTPRASDVERVAPAANSRTTTFGGGHEWYIKIDGAKLNYHSGDNKNAVERGRSHPVVAAMFRALKAINWTRATGGVFVGNDEYNQDSSYAGGGGNYITEDFGPLGEGERAAQMGLSLDKYRKIFSGKR